MLRIFVDTYDKGSSEEINGINVQHVSFDNVCSSSESIDSFKKFIDQYIKNKDEVVILTLDSKISNAYSVLYPLFDDGNVLVVNTSLPMSSMHIIVKSIINYNDKSFDGIRKTVHLLSEMLNSFSYILTEALL